MLRRDNPNSSVKSKDKVSAMSVEYDFIGDFLHRTGVMEKYQHIYQYHRCMAYHFTLNRISRELIYDFYMNSAVILKSLWMREFLEKQILT